MNVQAKADVIMLIRHAEKPHGGTKGVNEKGANDPRSLSPQGWQRAGALVAFFGAVGSAPTPDRIYVPPPGTEKVASHVSVGSKSNRPLETVTPLAAKLNREPIQTYGKGDEEALVHAITAHKGTTLVCWQHESIPEIAKRIMGTTTRIPDQWPRDRFDVVWRFTRADTKQPWKFDQDFQLLLAPDLPNPIV